MKKSITIHNVKKSWKLEIYMIATNNKITSQWWTAGFAHTQQEAQLLLGCPTVLRHNLN